MEGRSASLAATPLIALVVGVALIGSPASGASSEGGDGEVELVLLGDREPMRLVLDAEIGGTPLSALWDEAVAALLGSCDRDCDGLLDERELEGLPSAFGLRQLGWGVFRLAGPAPHLDQLDADGDGAVGPAELSRFYLGRGAGPVLVGVGRAASTARLNEAILRQLDADGDGRVVEAEAGAAEALLAGLDRNGDGRLSGDELVTGISYPGIRGTSQLLPPDPDRLDGESQPLPLAVLPGYDDGGRWAEGLVRHPDVSWDADTFIEWRTAPPSIARTITLDRPAGSTGGPESGRSDPPLAPGDWLTARSGDLAFHLRADEGMLIDALRADRDQLDAQFARLDADSDGTVEAGAVVDDLLASLRLAILRADRDGDGAADRAELDARSELIETLARARVLVSVLDHGRGLFEFIDADHDGMLSPRELRTAGDRLGEAGCLADGAIDMSRLPRTLIGCVSRGHPRGMLAERPPGGPDWFDGMDRNRDGVVSAGEWLGDPAVFRSFDADGDGLLAVDEVPREPR